MRFHCTACGNLTRFDVVESSRTRAYHHFTVAGERSIEDVAILGHQTESVTCRWCGVSGDAIEEIALDDSVVALGANPAASITPSDT